MLFIVFTLFKENSDVLTRVQNILENRTKLLTMKMFSTCLNQGELNSI